MTTRTVKLDLRCGEKTCAAEVGVFCTFLRCRMDGRDPVCSLFNKPLTDSTGDIVGWLLRCEECLKAELTDANRDVCCG
jgi:hypothetical protein